MCACVRPGSGSVIGTDLRGGEQHRWAGRGGAAYCEEEPTHRKKGPDRDIRSPLNALVVVLITIALFIRYHHLVLLFLLLLLLFLLSPFPLRPRVPVEFRLFWRDTLCPFAAVLDVFRKSKVFRPHLYPGNKTEHFSHLFYSIHFLENACRSRKKQHVFQHFVIFSKPPKYFVLEYISRASVEND